MKQQAIVFRKQKLIHDRDEKVIHFNPKRRFISSKKLNKAKMDDTANSKPALVLA